MFGPDETQRLMQRVVDHCWGFGGRVASANIGPRKCRMTGAEGYEVSDHWQESQLLMRLVRELWRRLESEATLHYPASAVP